MPSAGAFGNTISAVHRHREYFELAVKVVPKLARVEVDLQLPKREKPLS